MNEQDVDIHDEQQDWRFVSSVQKSTSLPKRGEKDFEPDGTGVQMSTLQESRNAMFNALSAERKHSGKAHVTAIWVAEKGLAKVDHPKGSHFLTMGHSDSHGAIWLFPEEVIYLVERGSMQCMWREGIVMSLEAVYSVCLSSTVPLSEVQVYSYLRKTGFSVRRYQGMEQKRENELKPLDMGLNYVRKFWFDVKNPIQKGDILCNRLYRSYDALYQDLHLIEYYKPDTELRAEKPFTITFNVWKPNSPNFKKSKPGPPDFQVVVLKASATQMPTLEQAEALFSTVAETSSEAHDSLRPMQKLKEGRKTVVLAVVDSGVISFSRISDVNFASQPMYHGYDVSKKSRAKPIPHSIVPNKA